MVHNFVKIAMATILRYCLLGLIFLFSELNGQNSIGTGNVNSLYLSHCASCHGEKLDGGLGPSLMDSSTWKTDGSDSAIARVIEEGVPELGMPSYKAILDKEKIRTLIIFIRELQHLHKQKPEIRFDPNHIYKSKKLRFFFEGSLLLMGYYGELRFSIPNVSVTDKKGKLLTFDSGEMITFRTHQRFCPSTGWVNGCCDRTRILKWNLIYLSYTGYGSKIKETQSSLNSNARGKIIEVNGENMRSYLRHH